MTVPLLILLTLIEFIAAGRSCVKSFTILFIEFDSVVQTFLIDDSVSNGNTAKNDIITIPIIVSIEGLFTIRLQRDLTTAALLLNLPLLKMAICHADTTVK